MFLLGASLTLSGTSLCESSASAQSRGNSHRTSQGSGNHRGSGTQRGSSEKSGPVNRNASTRSSQASHRTMNTAGRPGGGNSNRPNGGNNNRPNGGNNNRPNGGNRPNGNRPGGGNNNRPNGGNHGNNNRPGNNSWNNGNHNRPNGGNHGNRPGDNGYRPGNNHWNNGNHNRPGGNHWDHGTSAPRPGAGSVGHGRPPGPGYGPGYRPPHFSRWERPLPPPPPRPRHFYGYSRPVPTIGTVLGLTFGSLIDYGINSLLNAGWTVTSAIDNAIYLTNVPQFGVVWPEATVFYGPAGGMNGVRFQYGAYSPTDYRFRTAYVQLCDMYGDPISYNYENGYPVATWWGDSGYITLRYGPGVSQNGSRMYYTDLIYGM